MTAKVLALCGSNHKRDEVVLNQQWDHMLLFCQDHCPVHWQCILAKYVKCKDEELQVHKFKEQTNTCIYFFIVLLEAWTRKERRKEGKKERRKEGRKERGGWVSDPGRRLRPYLSSSAIYFVHWRMYHSYFAPDAQRTFPSTDCSLSFTALTKTSASSAVVRLANPLL